MRFSNWSNLEPDDGNIKSGQATRNEDCAVINPTMDWSDVPCWNRFQFICKFLPDNGRAISFGGTLSHSDVGNKQDAEFTQSLKNNQKPKPPDKKPVIEGTGNTRAKGDKMMIKGYNGQGPSRGGDKAEVMMKGKSARVGQQRDNSAMTKGKQAGVKGGAEAAIANNGGAANGASVMEAGKNGLKQVAGALNKAANNLAEASKPQMNAGNQGAKFGPGSTGLGAIPGATGASINGNAGLGKIGGVEGAGAAPANVQKGGNGGQSATNLAGGAGGQAGGGGGASGGGAAGPGANGGAPGHVATNGGLAQAPSGGNAGGGAPGGAGGAPGGAGGAPGGAGGAPSGAGGAPGGAGGAPSGAGGAPGGAGGAPSGAGSAPGGAGGAPVGGRPVNGGASGPAGAGVTPAGGNGGGQGPTGGGGGPAGGGAPQGGGAGGAPNPAMQEGAPGGMLPAPTVGMSAAPTVVQGGGAPTIAAPSGGAQLSPQQAAIAKQLANQIAPQLAKEYAAKFEPDMEMIQTICGKFCSDTAMAIPGDDPSKLGKVCGRICAESLMKMSPEEVMGVLAGMKNANAAPTRPMVGGSPNPLAGASRPAGGDFVAVPPAAPVGNSGGKMTSGENQPPNLGASGPAGGGVVPAGGNGGGRGPTGGGGGNTGGGSSDGGAAGAAANGGGGNGGGGVTINLPGKDLDLQMLGNIIAPNLGLNVESNGKVTAAGGQSLSDKVSQAIDSLKDEHKLKTNTASKSLTPAGKRTKTKNIEAIGLTESNNLEATPDNKDIEDSSVSKQTEAIKGYYLLKKMDDNAEDDLHTSSANKHKHTAKASSKGYVTGTKRGFKQKEKKNKPKKQNKKKKRDKRRKRKNKTKKKHKH